MQSSSTLLLNYLRVTSSSENSVPKAMDFYPGRVPPSSSSWPHLDYCPPNDKLRIVWTNNGFSHCFLETLVDSLSLSFILVFGVLQLWFYRKYATPVKHYVLPYSQLFGLQMVLNGLMTLVAFTHFILDIAIPLPDEPDGFYGYTILSLIQGVIVWPFACILVLQERNNMLPTVPRKGHGLTLMILWTWMFAAQNLQLLNLLSPNWFFRLSNFGDFVRFLLFLLEYAVTGLILILGIRAPGIPSFQNNESFMRLVSNEYVSYSALERGIGTGTGSGPGPAGLGRFAHVSGPEVPDPDPHPGKAQVAGETTSAVADVDIEFVESESEFGSESDPEHDETAAAQTCPRREKSVGPRTR